MNSEVLNMKVEHASATKGSQPFKPSFPFQARDPPCLLAAAGDSEQPFPHGPSVPQGNFPQPASFESIFNIFMIVLIEKTRKYNRMP